MLDACHQICNVPIRILLVVNIIRIHRPTTDKRTDYVGNIIYKNSSLRCLLLDGGYVAYFKTDKGVRNRVKTGGFGYVSKGIVRE